MLSLRDELSNHLHEIKLYLTDSFYDEEGEPVSFLGDHSRLWIAFRRDLMSMLYRQPMVPNAAVSFEFYSVGVH